MKYSSQGKQLTLAIFSTSLEKSLDSENRWYKLAHLLTWYKIEKGYYNATLHNEYGGGGNKSARMMVGALNTRWDGRTKLESAWCGELNNSQTL